MQGYCHILGCDGALNSTVQEDSCGVCGGDHSKCRNITHTFHRKLHRCKSIKKASFLDIVKCNTMSKALKSNKMKY